MSENEEQSLKCAECGRDFTWGAGEQDLYREQSFLPPTRCKSCNRAQKECSGGREVAAASGKHPTA